MFDVLGRGATTSMLNGGIEAWLESGGATAAGPPPPANPAPAPQVSPCPGALVDRSFVANHLRAPPIVLVDDRLPTFFSGAAVEPGELPGHIEGALNVPFPLFADNLAGFSSPAAMASAYRLAGVHRSDDVVVYCHSGNKAAIAYLAARILRMRARIYLGSWLDWSATR